MLTQRSKQLAYSLTLLDAAALGVAFTVAFIVRTVYPNLGSGAQPPLADHIWMLFLSVPLFWVLASQAGLYRDPPRRLVSGVARSVLQPFAYLALFLGTAVFLFQAKTFSRVVFGMFLLLSFFLVALVRVVLGQRTGKSERTRPSRRRVLIVGGGAEAREVGSRIQSHPEHQVELVGHLSGYDDEVGEGPPVLGSVEDLKRIVEDDVIDEVIIAVPFSGLLRYEQQIAWCEEVGVPVHLKVDFIRTLFAKTYPADFDGTPMLSISSTPQDVVGLMFKRLVDIIVSAVALVVLSPLLLVCAAGVRLTSRGPILFRQRRIGLNGRVFDLYKFRSMHEDAERTKPDLVLLNEMTGPVFKIRDDPRVTHFGRVLRRFSLDELPQLWSVLKGEMSLVGPRPPVASEVRQYQRWQRRRLSMKPGLTCLWQINGRNTIGFEEWMKLDLAYIDNWSLKLDFVILLRTVPAVLMARGAH